MLFNAEANEGSELVEFVYGDPGKKKLTLFDSNANNWTAYARWVAERAILAPTHEIVRDLNRKISLALPDQSTIVRSIDSVTDDAKHSWALLGEVAKCFPLYCLSLRTGDCVMVLRNLSNV